MRYFVMVLSIACLDLGKEDSNLVSMTGTRNFWRDATEDCTLTYLNDDSAENIDCEICDVYGFMIYSETTGQCEDDYPMNDDGIWSAGLDFETGMMYYLDGTTWLPENLWEVYPVKKREIV